MDTPKHQYRVTWCTSYAIDEDFSHAPDEDKHSTQVFYDIEEALRFANNCEPVGDGHVYIDLYRLDADQDAQPGEDPRVWTFVETLKVIENRWRLPEVRGSVMLPLAENLAESFTEELLRCVGIPGMRKIWRLNEREPDNKICHSHDICDPNVCMWDAFVEHAPGLVIDLENESICERWNEAWDLARATWKERFK